MNYHSENKINIIRIVVKEFDIAEMTYKYVRAERVAIDQKSAKLYVLWSSRDKKYITCSVYCYDWHTAEIHPTYVLAPHILKKALEKLGLAWFRYSN